MSGICGFAYSDGRSAEHEAIEAMTCVLDFRGPDGHAVHCDGPFAFGHTLLRTGPAAAREHQTLTLDGQAWITADARLDAREELVSRLRGAGRAATRDCSDAELILQAYLAWDEACPQHLLGDFCFAIWDSRSRRLFCARDHFGIRPFFYACVKEGVVFSNTLDCVRAHPAVGDALNELAIADFLVFGELLEPHMTAFTEIRRLQPGHSLTWASGAPHVRAYWTLPRELPVRFRPAGDYVECFREVFDRAVADRLRTQRVGVEMTGGLDSTSVAATAHSILSARGEPFEFCAYTGVYEGVIRDEEGRYAAEVARHVGFDLRLFVADGYRFYGRFDTPDARQPEPFHDPTCVERRDTCREMSGRARVFLTGWDGDIWLNESPKPYLRTLLREGRWLRAAADGLHYAAWQGHWFPRAWRDALLRTGGRTMGEGDVEKAYPPWIPAALEAKWGLRERWQSQHGRRGEPHALRPYAFRAYDYLVRASNHFDYYDPALTGAAVEYRHPFMDLRLAEFCLSLPVTPWCVQKHVLREAMRNRLPAAVLARPKTPLGPHRLVMTKRDESAWAAGIDAEPGLDRYVEAAKLELGCARSGPARVWRDLRAVSLNHWLRHLRVAA